MEDRSLRCPSCGSRRREPPAVCSAHRIAAREPPETASALEPDSRVPGYVVRRLLGRGGFGAVWEATRDGQRVALKIAAPDSARAAHALRNEARALRALDGAPTPSLVEDGSSASPAPFLAMSLVTGLACSTLMADEAAVD